VNKLNGAKLDMIVFDEVASMTSEQEKHLEKIMRLATMYGTKTGRFSSAPERICSYCKHEQFGHQPYTDEYSDGHPFFNNNLEYLEWLSERKTL